MPRKTIDLRNLPVWLQYLTALAVAAIVMTVAWFVGRDKPVPDWIDNYLVPGLGWLSLLLIIVAAVSWIRKKRLSHRTSNKPDGKVSS